MKKFYMVYREGNQSPTKKHDDIAEAACEATRLSEKHPGEKFYVLEALWVISGNITVTNERLS